MRQIADDELKRRKEFFESILDATGNLEIAANLYLVSMGGRDATLIEAANYSSYPSELHHIGEGGPDNIDYAGLNEFEKYVEIAQKLPNVRTAWESKGNQPRFLVVNKTVPHKLFRRASDNGGNTE